MEQLRQFIPYEEFDYLTLVGSLKTYARPRDKITALLRAGTIVRVKKGLYVFGPPLRREAYSQELLANWIYGPSYLSLEYALGRYGMIPDGSAIPAEPYPLYCSLLCAPRPLRRQDARDPL